MRELHFLAPGDLDSLTGGYIYDRRIVDGLRASGWRIAVHSLSERFPDPDDEALAQARRTLAKIPEGMPVVIDGLALGAMPELAHAAAARRPLVALVHHPLAQETGIDCASAARLHDSERRALAAARHVIVTSPATARALEDYGVAADRVTIVEPGTERAPLACGSGSDEPQLLCVATLTPRKGHAVLFDALARIADRRWRLTCAGSGRRAPETTAALERQLERLGISQRVRLIGELPPQGLVPLYHRADIFVLASYLEGYGMALAEALARGLPVVSTLAGAIPETVPADAGILVPAGNVLALAEALARIMDDRDLRTRLAAGARAARTRLPSWRDAAERFGRVLDEVLCR